MATISTPQRAVVQRPRSPHSDTDQQQQIFLALQVHQIPLQRRWILELVNLFLTKLPPAQPPLPSLLPRFNLSPRTQATPLHIQLPSRLPSFLNPVSPPTGDHSSPPPPAPRQKDQIFSINYPEYSPIKPSGSCHERREQRRKDLKRLLGPLQSDDGDSDGPGCVLLCWGGPSACHVLAVEHMERDMDHELFWKRLRGAWFAQRGRWCLHLPWYGIKGVRTVEIRLVGPDPDTKGLFRGVYRMLDSDIEAEKQRLREKMRSYRPPIEKDWVEHGFHDSRVCKYNYFSGETIHDPYNCPRNDYEPGYPFYRYIPPCPVSEHYDNEKRLAELEMEPLGTPLFQNPKMAVHNELFNANLVYCRKDVLDQYKWEYCPSLGQLVFRGLRIEDGWTFDSTMPIIFMPLAVVASVLIVFFARLIFGDWSVAWNVGACFVPLLAGVGSWLHHASASRS